MTERATHPTDDLAAFAIGALDASEGSRIRAHVDSCQACAAEVASFGEVAWSLAELAPTPRVARDLRERIVARARSRRRTSPLVWLSEALTWRVPAAVPVALGLALIASVAGLAGARAEAEVARSQLISHERTVAGVADARVVNLTPAAGSQARGTLVMPTDGDPYLILRLPPAPPGHSWEAWIIRDQQPHAAGGAQRAGVVTMNLALPMRPGDAVAITLEPGGGGTTPRGDMVLQGRP